MELGGLENSFSEIVRALQHEKELKTKNLETQERINEELTSKLDNQDQ